MATFRTGQKTHRAVLPQRPALESVPADTSRIGKETGHGHHHPVVTGAEHGRGETTSTSPGAGGVTPNPRVGEQHREVRTIHPFGFVLDKYGLPLQPCSPARARELLAKGRAVVARHTPFTTRVKDRTNADSEVDGAEVGIDPGSKHTGIAVFTAQAGEGRGRYSLQLDHRGAQITKKMGQRAGYRRRRRSKNLRYRTPRFNKRTLNRILAQAKAPLRNAAAMNSTRWALGRPLEQRLPTHVPSGGRTKSHTLDALAVGKVDTITQTVETVLVTGCSGRGSYARTRPDKHGFPRLRLPRTKRFFSFATGDLVRAVVPTGKKAGTHTGRVAARATGRFNVTTTHGTVQGISHRHVRLLQRADGYAYTARKEKGVPSHRRRSGFPRPTNR